MFFKKTPTISTTELENKLSEKPQIIDVRETPEFDAKHILGNAKDAIGINSKVAERLSGADFDGDTVMVIPTGKKINITSTPALQGLKDFDAKDQYGPGTYDPAKTRLMKRKSADSKKEIDNTQIEMGKISNLITDMTLKGATDSELTRAVRHSMVVIDAGKHKLNYKQSELDNNIASLKKKYQGHYDEDGSYHEGSATLISKAKSQVSITKRQGTPKVNLKGKEWYDPDQPEGALLYKEVTESYTDAKGKTKTRMQTSTKMAETKDARTLSSGTVQEEAYADYANKMKSLANQARKEMVTTGNIEYHASAKSTYKKEVDHLDAQLNLALKNAPRERKAQVLANAEVAAKKQANPDMTKGEIKKASQQALTKARASVGAKRTSITISDREWEAIQAGAISENKLTQILNNTNTDDVRKLATPRSTTTITPAKQSKIASMNASGYTIAEIAESLGVSTSSVSTYIK